MKLFKKIILLMFLPVLTNAQENLTDINAIANKLLLRIRSASTEQIILQTNKKIYAPNESIWFTAYEVDSLTGRLRNTSKVLFADLVDAKDKVIHHLVLNIADGQQTGAFLHDSSLNGFYWIRAYTENILHHNINNMAVKPLYIVNENGRQNYHLNAGVTKTATAGNTYRFTFYPEGGSLISGASSVVALKLTDDAGTPVSDSVLIKDNRNEIVAKFLTNDKGLAKFAFEPSTYKTYGVFVLKDNHYDSVTTLPHTDPFAMQIAITQQTDQSVKLRVLLEDSIYKADYKTFLIALHKDSIYMAAQGKANYEFNLPTSNLAPGITHFLLYNTNGKLVSERDIYIKKNDIAVATETGSTVYGAREKADINFSVTDKGKPVVTTVSISVNDSRVTDSLNNFSLDTLASMSANDAELVMLTKANQNIFYSEDASNPESNLVSNKDNLFINGVLFNHKNEPAANKPVLLISNNDGLVLQDTTTTNGNFSFELASFITGTPFSMQVNDDKSTKDNYHIVLDSGLNFNFKTPAGLKEFFSADQLQNLKKTESFYTNSVLSGHGWLPEVTVKTKASLKNTNSFPETIIPKEVLHSGGVSNVAEAVLRYSKMHVIGGFLMTGGPNGFKPSPSDEPEIVMDGSRIEQASSSGSVLGYLKTISTSGVDHIKILTGASAAGYGILAGTGVIEIYSASNSTYSNVAPGGLVTIYPEGFDSAPEFLMPDYSDKRLKNSKDYDSRTAIFWNGNIITDENGKAPISFFTSDMPANYIVTISGLTAKGDRIYKTFTLNTK